MADLPMANTAPIRTPGDSTENRFPLGLCAAGIAATSLGLAAAALNFRWGASPPPGDSLQSAWAYVNVMLTFTLLLVWPVFVPHRGPTHKTSAFLPSRSIRTNLFWDFAALAASAIPALGVAAFLSGINSSMVTTMLLLQGSIGLFTLGTLTCCKDRAAWEAAAMGLLATLAVVAPVAVYLWAEFFPLAWNAWFSLVPAIAVVRRAQENSTPATPFLTPLVYALAGIILCFTRPSRPTA